MRTPPGYWSNSLPYFLFVGFLAIALVPNLHLARGQVKVTYVQQTANLANTFSDGGGVFDNGDAEIGMWANGGGKQVVAWRNFRTDGNNDVSDRTLQIGDVFTITVNATSAYGGIGFSLNAGETQGSSYANRVSGSRLFVQEVGTTASWEVNSASGTDGYTSLDYNVSTTRRDYTFKVYVTSATTANVLLNDGTTDKRAYNLTLNGTAGANIDAFSMWLADDWNGSSSANIYWKHETSVQNTGIVELGYFLPSEGTFTPGLITDGRQANSPSEVSSNKVFVGGDSGSQIVFDQANTYTGTTTINANARLVLGASEVIPDASNVILFGGTLRTGSTTGFSETAGTLKLEANSTIDFGTGSHTLAFAASNSVSWKEATALTVTDWVAGATILRFGSDATALTSDQLAQINFSGYGTGARILSTGEVIPASHYFAVNTGSYSSGATWYGSAAPTDTRAIHVQSGTLTLDGDQTVASLAISPDATFAFESDQGRALTISSGGTISNSSGTFTANDGMVKFPGTADVTGAVTFNDVELSGGVNFGPSSTVNGTLTVKSGGYANTNAPTFGDGSTLDFATGGDYEVGASTTLWVTGSVRGQGVPANVTVSTSNPLRITQDRTVTGALSVSSGASVQNSAPLTVSGNSVVGGSVSITGTSALTVAGDLSINAGGTVTLSSSVGGDLKVGGNLTVNGTLTKNERAVFMNGTGNQTITGASTMIFDYLLIESQSTTTISSALEIDNDLTVSGNLSTGGNLTIQSDAQILGSGSISGDVTFQRELTGTAGWRMLSSPVQSATYSSMLDPIWTQGSTNSDASGASSSSVFSWTNSSTGAAASNWSAVSDLNSAIPVGTGFLVYVFADDNNDGTAEGFPKTLAVSGVEHGDNVQPTINGNANGWTLVGNPFGRTIDFDAVSKADLTNIAYLWDHNASSWKSFSQQEGLGEISGGLIRPFQGFFVQTAASASSPPSLTFNVDDKTTGGSFYGKSQSSSTNKIRLVLSHEGFQNAAWLSLQDQGNATEQVSGDALELQPLSLNFVQLGIRKGDHIFDIAVLPSGNESYLVPLDVSSTFAGFHSLRATTVSIPDDLTVWLVDTETGDEVPIRDSSFVYDFSISSGKGLFAPLSDDSEPRPVQANSGNGDRFLLSVRSTKGSVDRDDIQHPLGTSLIGNYPNPFSGQTRIQFALREPNTISLTVFDILGRMVDAPIRTEYVSAGVHEAVFDASDLPAGTYLIRLQSGTNYAEHLRVVVQH